MTVTLTKVETQVTWRSPDAGNNTVSIPGSVSANKGYDLDISSTLANGDTYIVTPTSGTIDGQSNFTFTLPDNENCTLSLRSDADNSDWIVRCLCCVPAAIIYPLDVGTTSATPSPAAPVSSSSVSLFVAMNGGGPDLTWPPGVLLAQVYAHADPTSPATPPPSVTMIDDDRGLVWHKRSSVGGNDPLVTDSLISMEIWWTDARSLGIGDTITVTAHYPSPAYLPAIRLIEIDGTVNFPFVWDQNASLPATTVDDALRPSMPLISTSSAHAMILVFFATPTDFPNWFHGSGTDSFGGTPPVPKFAGGGYEFDSDGSAAHVDTSFAYTSYFDNDGGAQVNITVIPFIGQTDYPTDITITLDYNPGPGLTNLNGSSRPATYLMIVDAISAATFTPP